MGRFILSRSATGERFLLQSDVGRVLCTSREYATLDACKKGIASLVRFAPTAPLVDGTVGERGANPKFEITAVGDGFAFELKSANGKSVIVSGAYATKKACLRAVSMLRSGVVGAEVFFSRPAGLQPLKMQAIPVAERRSKVPPKPVSPRVTVSAEAESVAPAMSETPPVPSAPPTPSVTVAHSTKPSASAPKAEAQPSTTVVPRLIRLAPVSGGTPKPQGTKPVPAPKSAPAKKSDKKRSVLDIFFKK